MYTHACAHVHTHPKTGCQRLSFQPSIPKGQEERHVHRVIGVNVVFLAVILAPAPVVRAAAMFVYPVSVLCGFSNATEHAWTAIHFIIVHLQVQIQLQSDATLSYPPPLPACAPPSTPMRANTHKHKHKHTRTYTRAHTHIHTHTHTCTHTHTQPIFRGSKLGWDILPHTHTHIHTYIHTHTHTHARTHTHTHTHTHTRIHTQPIFRGSTLCSDILSKFLSHIYTHAYTQTGPIPPLSASSRNRRVGEIWEMTE